MQRAQALGKTLILGKIEGRRRRGWQRVRWLDGITDSMDMNLKKLQERVKDRQAHHTAIPGVAKSHWTRTTGRIPHALGQLSSEATTNEPACPRACALQQKCGEVKVALSCPTIWDPMDCTVRGIFQARMLEWVAFPFSMGSSQFRDRTQVSHVAGGFFTSWAKREDLEYWSG